MRIYLKKFGSTLVSRQAGKEAFAAFQPVLNTAPANEDLEIDFSGVITFSPSWGDEFLTPLERQFMTKLSLININDNPSVIESLKIIEQITHIHFQTK